MSDRVSTVLVVDDEPGIRIGLQANFRRFGWEADIASSVKEAIRRLEGREFDLVVTDVRLPDGSGVEVMRMARQFRGRTAVILLTAYGSVPEAVGAIRDGALDYLSKPVGFDELQHVISRVLDIGAARLHDASASGSIVGHSPLLLRELEKARAAAATGVDVLIQAESGTGKELLARFVHNASNRANKPFVAVNCAAVPESLLESELFGHGRGAFTGAMAAKPGKFELAHGGTILLDEIGEMPLHLQPKLLRALQEREIQRLGEARLIQVDIQVIATTNVSLSAMVGQGKFRSDLYYRLNVIPLTLPPLRSRGEDIEDLARHFAREFSNQMGLRVPSMTDGFLDRLRDHTWPGNVRELANFMKRVLALHRGADLDGECFQWESGMQEAFLEAAASSTALAAGTTIRQVERRHLENTLALTNGNRTHAAEMLGISLRTLRNKIREYGLPPRRYA